MERIRFCKFDGKIFIKLLQIYYGIDLLFRFLKNKCSSNSMKLGNSTPPKISPQAGE